MSFSRRDLALLVPILAAATANAQKKTLPSSVSRFADLPVKTNGGNTSRQVIDGLTHTAYHIDLHETELAPGAAPHAAHEHLHEEIVMVREGTLEFTISGKVSEAGPGSVTYIASNEHHSSRNIGTKVAHYFVIALGRADA